MENKNIQTEMVGNKVWGNITYKNEQAFELSGETQSDRQIESVFTPIKIVKGMVDVLDSEVVDELCQSYFESQGILNKRILDIYCKSGRFLSEIRDRFFRQNQYKLEYEESLENHTIDNKIYDKTDTSRKQFIINNNLFGICPDEMTRLISQREVAGDPFSGNFRVVKENSGINKTDNSLFQAVQEIRFEIPDNNGGTKTVEFDTVVGNPPYNGGGDIDFVIRGFNLSKSYVLMITPAKWQTAEADQKIQSVYSYKYFRDTVVKHMKYVCFYPDCKDVFQIMQSDGITYYLINTKQVYDSCTVVNKCNNVKYFNQTQVRDIRNREQLINVGDEINKILKDRPKFKFRYLDMSCRYAVCTNCQLPGGGLYAITSKNKSVYYLGVSETYDMKEPYWNLGMSQQMKITFTQNSKEECDSFAQYLNSRFVRFFIAINISKLAPVNQDDYFRFVPEPPNNKYDHIFTDEELYRYFGLPDKYIGVINSAVKSR